jgi:hypothetical protein
MKNPLIFIIPVVLLGITACKKLGDPTSIAAITSDESALMIAGSLASGSNGFVSLSNDATITSQTIYSTNKGCGITHADTINHQSLSGATITYSFKHIITSKLNCNTNKQPDNVTSNFTFSGSYNGPKLSAKQSGSANSTIAGLTPTSAVYVVNGQFKSTGSYKLKPDTTRAGTIAIDIVVKNVVISKATVAMPAIITGGTATVTITGNSPKGAFLFDGTLTFTGFNEAILTLGNNRYSINLTTGAVAKK